MASKPIKIKVTGDSKDFLQAIGKAESGLKNFGKKAGAAIGVGVAALAAGAVKLGSNIEEAKNTITAGTGLIGEDLQAVFDSAVDLSEKVPESLNVVAGAMADVNTMFGQSGAEAVTTGELFLDAARVMGSEDVSGLITSVSQSMEQFGTDSSVDEVLSDLVTVSQATGAPLESLMGSMTKFGPLMANAGFTLEETSAFFGQLTQAGVDVTKIGPGLNKFFRGVASEGGDGQEQLELVVQSMMDAATETEALNIATAAFGAEGAQRMTTAVRSGNVDLENFSGLLGENAGAVDLQADATETMGDRLAIMGNLIQAKLIPVLESLVDWITTALIPAIQSVAGWFRDDLFPVIRNIVNFIKDHDWVWVGLAVILGGGLVLALGVVIPLVWAKAAAWAAAAAAMIVANAPVLLITAAIALLAAGVVWAYQNVDFFRSAVDGMKDAAVVAFHWLRDNVPPIFQSIWNAIEPVVTFMWILASTWVQVQVKIIKIGAKIVTWFVKLPGKIKDATIGAFDGLKDAFKGAINWIIDKWNSLSFTLPKMSLDVPLDGRGAYTFGGQTFGVPKIPRLAKGGTLTSPGTVMVGEAGPEFLNLPVGAEVRPLDNAGSSGVTVFVSTDADPYEIGREVAWAIKTGNI